MAETLRLPESPDVFATAGNSNSQLRLVRANSATWVPLRCGREVALRTCMTSRTVRLFVAPFLAALTIVGCASESPTGESSNGPGGGKGDSWEDCEDYTDSDACAAAGCEWYPGSIANDRPDLCLP